MTVSIAERLAELARLDIKLWVDEGKLRINAPQGAMTPALREELGARKAEIVEFLQRGHAPVAAALVKREPGQRVPLTHGQERIWTLARMEPGSSVYNVPTVFQLAGKLDVARLERSIDALVRRHESLRTVFPGSDMQTAQQQVLAHSPVLLPVSDVGVDIAKMPQEQQQKALDQLLRAEAAKPFDLEKGPLWRVRLFRLQPGRHVLAFTMHHIVFDGVSKAIFLGQLAANYRALADTAATDPPPAELQFADYAVWQRARLDDATLDRQLDYWKKHLPGDVPALATPNEKPRVPGKGKAGSVQFSLPPDLTASLQHLAQGEKTGLFVVLLAGFNVVLHGYTGQRDQLLVTPMASRDRAEIERMVGYFNNIVVMRCALEGNPRFREMLGRLRALSIEAFDNQYVPLQLVAQLPNLVRTPLTRGMFSYQDASSRILDLPGLKTAAMSVRKDAADFDLALYTELEGDRITGVLDFNADIFGGERIKMLLQRYSGVLREAVAQPDKRLADFPSYGRGLAELEKQLSQHPQIEQAILQPDAATGEHHAYLVLNEHDVPSLDAIREHARKIFPAYRVPASFIPVDEMPLAPDGSVDRAALPPPGGGRDRLATAYAAPRSELEKSLAAIWKQVLWLGHDVGIHDSFRELGGHSLLSVQMVVEIEKTLGRPVPPHALATLNTVAELAAALEGAPPQASGAPEGSVLPADIYHGLRSHTASWEGKRTRPESVMVGLNTEGGRQRIFWCLQRYQELQQLAKYLGADQPVYGMRSGNRVMVKTQDNINLLASHYVGEILEVQPQGPYLIGGNCQAALIAFQVASQLRERGHEITLLVMQEKFAPFPFDAPVALLFGDRSVYNPTRYYARPEQGWHKYYSGPVAYTQVQGEHGQFFREPNVQVLTAAIKRHVEAAQAGTFSDAPARTVSASQVLPAQAYRASVSAALDTIGAGECRAIRVQVKNESGVDWQPSAISGLHVGNRWVTADGKEAIELDGRVGLEALPAGQTTTVELPVRAPGRPGRWVLEIDVIDEGVAWFRERGSTPCCLQLNVNAPVAAGA